MTTNQKVADEYIKEFFETQKGFQKEMVTYLFQMLLTYKYISWPTKI